MKKWLKIDDGVIFLRYICRKGCIINQKGLKFGRKKQYLLGILCMFAVTSFAEVWIEINMNCKYYCRKVSLPSRKCGLKCLVGLIGVFGILVTSFAEVWIEIDIYKGSGQFESSLPSRKCGLKYFKFLL